MVLRSVCTLCCLKQTFISLQGFKSPGRAQLIQVKTKVKIFSAVKTQRICSISPLPEEGNAWSDWHSSQSTKLPAMKAAPATGHRPHKHPRELLVLKGHACEGIGHSCSSEQLSRGPGSFRLCPPQETEVLSTGQPPSTC